MIKMKIQIPQLRKNWTKLFQKG